jgi:hypothetical protein
MVKHKILYQNNVNTYKIQFLNTNVYFFVFGILKHIFKCLVIIQNFNMFAIESFGVIATIMLTILKHK